MITESLIEGFARELLRVQHGFTCPPTPLCLDEARELLEWLERRGHLAPVVPWVPQAMTTTDHLTALRRHAATAPRDEHGRFVSETEARRG